MVGSCGGFGMVVIVMLINQECEMVQQCWSQNPIPLVKKLSFVINLKITF